MAALPTPSAVATLVFPAGEEDPAQLLRSNQYSIMWGDGQAVRKFREVKIPQIKEDKLALPTLYLHFLDSAFRVESGSLCHALRSGNDMSEVVVKLPSKYLSTDFAQRCEELENSVKIVIEAIRSQGEVMVGKTEDKQSSVDPKSLFFSLKTARPKAPLSLDKKAFGIPSEAEQYLFVNNHASVVYFDDDVRKAFNECIENLQELSFPDAKKFGVFLKAFYEGGFGYNKKIPCGQAYLPVNVGIAAMNMAPAWEGQVGIGTGYPYQLSAPFLPFTETVPISIDAIKSMSDRHGRYGLAFTRTVYVWEGDAWESDRTLDFCSILPHGGFFYVPSSLRDHRLMGGLVYAFGESTEDSTELSA